MIGQMLPPGVKSLRARHKIIAEPPAHDLRLNEGGPVDSEGGSLLDLEARLAKPCLFPFDGEPYQLTECQ